MEWKSFIALKQGRRQVPRIDELERLADLLQVDSGFVFQVARGTPAEEIVALLGRETELRALLDRVADGVFTIDLDGQFRDVNERLGVMLGHSRAALLGGTLLDFVTSESAPHALGCIAAAREGSSHSTELDFVTAAGGCRSVEVDLLPIGGAGGARIGAQAVARDVTERRKLVRELGENRRLLKTIFDHVPAACILFEADGTISAANPLVERVSSATAAEMLGKNANDVFGNPGPIGCPVTRAFLTGGVEQQVSWMTNRRGDRVYVHRTAGPVREGDKVVRVIEIMVDVSAQIERGDLRVLSLWKGLPEDLAAPGSTERRAAPRACVSFAASLRFEESTFDVTVTNLGAGGLFVETGAEIPVGARIDIFWTLPVDGIPVHAAGIAVWTRKRRGPVGVGVRFTEIEPHGALRAS